MAIGRSLFALKPVTGTLEAPTLTWTSADTELDPTFHAEFDSGETIFEEDDILTVEISETPLFLVLYDSEADTLTSLEAASGEIEFSDIDSLEYDTQYWARLKFERDGQTTYSNTVTETMAADPGGGGGPVAFDAASDDFGEAVDTLSWTHTPVDANPSAVVVGVVWWQASFSNPTSATYGGQAMTLESSAADSARVRMYSLGNPPTGAQTVEITWALADVSTCGGAITFTGSDESDVMGAAVTNAQSTQQTVEANGVVSEADAMVVDVAACWGLGPIVAGAGQTERCAIADGTLQIRMSTQAGAATVDMTWDQGSASSFSIVAASVNPG